MSSFNPLVLGASARPKGNTCTAVELLFGELPTIHLCHKTIHHYSYDAPNESDDFMPLIHELVHYDPWIIATPVYWYSMSGLLKTFWDRCTDLIIHHRDVLKIIKGKTVLLAASSHGGMPDEFPLPIEKTVTYLKMKFGGSWDLRFPLESHEAYNASQKESAQVYWQALRALMSTPPGTSTETTIVS